jgi:hypothetical protein
MHQRTRELHGINRGKGMRIKRDDAREAGAKDWHSLYVQYRAMDNPMVSQ